MKSSLQASTSRNYETQNVSKDIKVAWNITMNDHNIYCSFWPWNSFSSNPKFSSGSKIHNLALAVKNKNLHNYYILCTYGNGGI